MLIFMTEKSEYFTQLEKPVFKSRARAREREIRKKDDKS